MTTSGRHNNKCYPTIVVYVVMMSAMAVTTRAVAIVFDEPIATTFEGGQTATVPADDSIYMTEEVAAFNTTAAAAGDYEYDDYESSTDTVRTGRGRHASKPAKYVLANTVTNKAHTAATIVVIPAATTIAAITVPLQTTTTAVPTTTFTMPSTNPSITTSVPTTTTTVPTTTTEVPSNTTEDSSNATNVSSNTTKVLANTTEVSSTTTQTGVIMQIASPPGYDATFITNTIISTTPIPSSSLALGHSSLFAFSVAAITVSAFA